VAPQPIESKLKNNVLVAQAALVGDKHKFICVLIAPNFVALKMGAAPRIEVASRTDLVATAACWRSTARLCAR